jgi:hypothetical protein
METIYRIAIVCLLLFATGGLCVQYERADLWTYPNTEEIAADPGAYDGQRVLLFGTIESVDHATGELLISSGTDPEIQLTVHNAPPSLIDAVDTDGSIQIYGTLSKASSVVVADNVVVDYRHTADKTYVHLTSVLGSLLAAGVFLWYWRPNLRRLQFELRGDE